MPTRLLRRLSSQEAEYSGNGRCVYIRFIAERRYKLRPPYCRSPEYGTLLNVPWVHGRALSPAVIKGLAAGLL